MSVGGTSNTALPSRAALRRARQAEEAAARQAAPGEAPAYEPDMFDDVPETDSIPVTRRAASTPAPEQVEHDAGTPVPGAAGPSAAGISGPDAGTAAPQPVAEEAAPEPAPTTAAPAPAEPGSSPERPAVASAEPELNLTSPEGRLRALRELTPSLDRETFLRPDEGQQVLAERGFRGLLVRLGLKVEPSASENQERAWRHAIAAKLDRPRTISVVNGKGGANKTPTTVLLSAAFGHHGAEPVLAWDNNGTRGTLGWRTASGPHEAHAMDLLAVADEISHGRSGATEIEKYVHYQPQDRYSVLRTDPRLLASEQQLRARDFDSLHDAVARHFGLTVIDSGNDESAERWIRMIDHTDQLVIASTTVEEHAEAGALLLEALAKRGGHYAELARNAVVIVSQHQQRGNREQLGRVAYGFRKLARAVVTVPYDPALVKGPISFEALRPATRRSWLEAAAAVAGGLK